MHKPFTKSRRHHVRFEPEGRANRNTMCENRYHDFVLCETQTVQRAHCPNLVKSFHSRMIVLITIALLVPITLILILWLISYAKSNETMSVAGITYVPAKTEPENSSPQTVSFRDSNVNSVRCGRPKNQRGDRNGFQDVIQEARILNKST